VFLRSASSGIVKISIFLALIASLVVYLSDVLKGAFVYNVQINSVILAGLFIGIANIFVCIFKYDSEYSKLLKFDMLSRADIDKLKLIRPISLYVSKSNKLISQYKLQTIMSSIEKRMDDFSKTSKYLSGSLIFLGLLGTFWGLSHTIGNVACIIDNLGIENTDPAESFAKLKDSLKIPLAGMGIAFGCSLFGLSGSLVLGFLNTCLSSVADDFFGRVEEWVTKHTVSFDSVDSNQEYHGQIFSMALLEKTIETMYAFQGQLKDWDLNRIGLVNIQSEISQKMSKLTELLVENQGSIKSLIQNQSELQGLAGSVVKKMTDSLWKDVVDRLSSIDSVIGSIANSSMSNRDYIVENLGKDIRLISKTLSALVREDR
jgi:hypothetical protein